MKHHLSRNTHLPLAITLTLLLASTAAAAPNQLILGRDTAPPADIKGPIDLTIVPDFDDARVTVTVDARRSSKVSARRGTCRSICVRHSCLCV